LPSSFVAILTLNGEATLDLTTEANAEVRRNLLTVFGIIAVCLLLFVIAPAMVINPPGGSERFRFGDLIAAESELVTE
jgi:hypothetical protein